MTPNDVRLRYNKETGNETVPSLNREYDYVKWLEEELIKAWEQIAIGLDKPKDTVLTVQNGKIGISGKFSK